MNKQWRVAFMGCLAGGILLGTSMSATAETPVGVNTPGTGSMEMALRGPDRSPRAPQRAITAPTRRTESTRRQETIVTPPAAPVEAFVYKKTDCRPLTNTNYDIWGSQHRVTGRASVYVFDDGRIHMWSPTDAYLVNKLGAMGADREFLRLDVCERLGVWTNGRIAGTSPTTIVSEMTARLEALTCGEWTDPEEAYVAGVPVIKSTGWDEYGNFFYEIYAFERFGNTYAFASRVPYKNRYNTERNVDLAYLISHIHPAVWVE